MPLPFHPHPGTVLVCNFDTGFRPPEMVKVRPVVVVSPRRRRGSGLCTVVPLSSTAPDPVEPHHLQIHPESLPARLAKGQTWAKGDMLYTVSFERLDRVRDGKDRNGRRRYVAPRLPPAEFQAVQRAVAIGLGLDQMAHLGG